MEGDSSTNKPLVAPPTPTKEYGTTTALHESETDSLLAHPPTFEIVEEPLMQARYKKSSRQLWTLLVSVVIAAMSGSVYGFGRYSTDLKHAMGISQVLVQRFGILLDTGNYTCHPVTGWIYDHFGAKISCLLAAVLVFLSYITVHMGMHSAPIWLVELGFFGIGFGSGLGYLTSMGSTSSTFMSTPYFGLSVGLVAAGCGFAPTAIGLTYNVTGLNHFFLLWAVMVSTSNLFGAAIYPSKDVGAVQKTKILTHKDSDVESRHKVSKEILTGTQQSSSVEEDKWTSWKSADFWLLLLAFGCMTGCGLFVFNNLSSMVETIGGQSSFTSNLVLALSFFNVTGRVLMGYLADHPKVKKLDLFRYSSLLMALALAVSAVFGTNHVSLVLTVTICAFSYGGSWVLIVGILTDFFGRKNFGKDYGFMGMAPSISGMIFNSLSARIYQYYADDETGICVGVVCYRYTYWLTACAATVGFLILSRIPHSS